MSNAINLNISMLQEMGDSAYFRLPSDIPHLPRPLRGRVKSAAKLAKMALYTMLVFKAADEDTLAARNEIAMSKSASNAGARNEHFNRAQVLSLQATRRYNACGARLLAICNAAAL